MKTALTLCAALIASGMLLNPSLAYSQDGTVSLDDVVLLAQSDISDQTILTYLKYRNLDLALDADAVQRLRKDGVSEEIIRYLLERDSTSVAATPTYVVATGYNTGYPSYYYGARLVGTTVYPLSWYHHHYYPLRFSTVYRPGAHYGPGISHSVGVSPGHEPIHSPGILGGNHRIGQSGLSLGRNVGHNVSHSSGISGGHARRH
jgi:hypothetical protein